MDRFVARDDGGEGSFFVLPVTAETAVGGGVAGFRVVEISMVKDREEDEGSWSSMDRRVASLLAMTAS